MESIIVDEANPIYDSRNNCNAIIRKNNNSLLIGCKNTVIPNNILAVSNGAFWDCEGLISLNIPASVSYVGTQAFFGCYNLTSITVDSINTSLDSRNNCNAIIDTNKNMLVVGCSTTVIPTSVKSIGDYAFVNQKLLNTITFHKDITYYGKYAFAYCETLTKVISWMTEPFPIDESTFFDSRTFSFNASAILYVPRGTKTAYRSTQGWSLFKKILEMGDESVIDINPLPSNESDFSDNITEYEDLSNANVDDILFTLNSDNGDGYNATEGCIVMNSTMSDEEVNVLDLSLVGTPEFASQFTGLVFAVTSGKGTISINLQTLGQHSLGIKVGSGAVVKIVNPERSTVIVNYNVASNAYVLVYARSTNSTSAPAYSYAPANENSLKIYSVAWNRTGDFSETDGINEVSTNMLQLPSFFSVGGQHLNSLTKGLNIIRQADGTTRKVVVK